MNIKVVHIIVVVMLSTPLAVASDGNSTQIGTTSAISSSVTPSVIPSSVHNSSSQATTSSISVSSSVSPTSSSSSPPLPSSSIHPSIQSSSIPLHPSSSISGSIPAPSSSSLSSSISSSSTTSSSSSSSIPTPSASSTHPSKSSKGPYPESSSAPLPSPSPSPVPQGDTFEFQMYANADESENNDCVVGAPLNMISLYRLKSTGTSDKQPSCVPDSGTGKYYQLAYDSHASLFSSFKFDCDEDCSSDKCLLVATDFKLNACVKDKKRSFVLRQDKDEEYCIGGGANQDENDGYAVTLFNEHIQCNEKKNTLSVTFYGAADNICKSKQIDETAIFYQVSKDNDRIIIKDDCTTDTCEECNLIYGPSKLGECNQSVIIRQTSGLEVCSATYGSNNKVGAIVGAVACVVVAIIIFALVYFNFFRKTKDYSPVDDDA